MIYLSAIPLDTRSRTAQRLLGNPYEMHCAIMRAFPTPHGDRPLFRTEEGGAGARVLVQHLQEVDWSRAFGDEMLAGPPGQKPVPLQPQPGQSLRFLLRANPTKRLPHPDGAAGGKTGPRVDLRTEAEQSAWLERKAEAGGFRLVHLRVVDQGALYAWKRAGGRPGPGRGGGGRLTHRSVEYSGVLTVVDAGALLETVRTGIGSGKGLGFGLLSLGPA